MNESIKQRVEELESQIDRLAKFIMENIPDEPSQSEGAVDTTIRLLKAAQVNPGLKELVDMRSRAEKTAANILGLPEPDKFSDAGRQILEASLYELGNAPALTPNPSPAAIDRGAIPQFDGDNFTGVRFGRAWISAAEILKERGPIVTMNILEWAKAFNSNPSTVTEEPCERCGSSDLDIHTICRACDHKNALRGNL